MAAATQSSKMPMKSFVTDILSVAGKLEKEDLTTKLAQLSQKVEEVKIEVHDALHKKYADFQPTFDATISLRNRISAIDKDIDSLHATIEKQTKGQVRVSAVEYENLFSNYEESKATVLILNGLIEIHEGLQALSTAVGDQKLSSAAELISRLDSVFTRLHRATGNGIHILSHLRASMNTYRERLHTQCEERWSDFMLWTNNPSSQDDSNANRRRDASSTSASSTSATGTSALEAHVQLTFNTDKECIQRFTEALQTLATMSMLQKSVKSFSTRLMKHIIKPTLSYPQASVVSKQLTTFVSITVKRDKGLSEVRNESECQDVIKHFQLILDVLSSALIGLKFTSYTSATESNDDSQSNESGVRQSSESGVRQARERTLLEEMGSVIREELVDLLLTKCLTPAIPSDYKQLKNYAPVLTAVIQLQTRLVKIRLLPPDDKALLEFVSNIGVMFVNKKCQKLLEHCRTLMMSPLHNVVTVGPSGPSTADLGLPGAKTSSPGAAPTTRTSESTTEQFDESVNEKLGQIFDFPKCQISVGVRDLVACTYEAMHEAATLSSESTAKQAAGSALKSGPKDTAARSTECVITSESAVQLFYTVRSVFELYVSMVPVYHRDQLATLPLFAAVHHNDCMYLAHHLSILGSQYRSSLPKPLSSGLATFIDIIPVLRRLGAKNFLSQLSGQRSHILELFLNIHGFASVGDESNYEACERAVKQALLQLRHLGAVWRGVLPSSVYCRAIGTLINSVIVEIVTGIVALEDMSVSDADCLHSLLSLIHKAGPELIQYEETAESTVSCNKALMLKNCAKWNQLQELMLVLKASLGDISDRWADGLGPLAVEFSANQMKQLVRALFQNTDRRAALLLQLK